MQFICIMGLTLSYFQSIGIDVGNLLMIEKYSTAAKSESAGMFIKLRLKTFKQHAIAVVVHKNFNYYWLLHKMLISNTHNFDARELNYLLSLMYNRSNLKGTLVAQGLKLFLVNYYRLPISVFRANVLKHWVPYARDFWREEMVKCAAWSNYLLKRAERFYDSPISNFSPKVASMLNPIVLK